MIIVQGLALVVTGSGLGPRNRTGPIHSGVGGRIYAVGGRGLGVNGGQGAP